MAYPIPICPNESVVIVGDTVTWDVTHFPEPENWIMEVWVWKGDRYVAWDFVPFSRGQWVPDHPLTDPRFYVRHIYRGGYNRCGRTEWYLGD